MEKTRRVFRYLFLELLLSSFLLHGFLPTFIETKVIKNASLANMILEELEQLNTLFKLDLLYNQGGRQPLK